MSEMYNTLELWDEARGPFYQYGLTLIPASINKYIHYTVWGEITYPLFNFNDAAVEVWDRRSNFIPHFAGHVITYDYPCCD